MRDELHRHLDGELSAGELPEELREEARVWASFFQDVRAVGSDAAPADLEAGVMARLREERAAGPSGWKRLLDWWVRPRPIPVPPLAGALAAAAIAYLLLVPPGDGPATDVRTGAEDAPTTLAEAYRTGAAEEGAAVGEPTVYVQFLLRAPEASSVALAGDFNGWEPITLMEDPSGDGTWTARVPLRPGVHEYMFVIDGSHWVTDPHAERYAEDGFGNRNAVLAIAPAAPGF